jgi:hypothetical protein
MADSFTTNLRLRMKEPGSLFTERDCRCNGWGSNINADLETIDRAIRECADLGFTGDELVNAIRERLRGKLRFFGGFTDGIRGSS